MKFVDLKAQYQAIRPSVRERIDAVLEHGNYIMGPEVKELESRLAAYAGTRHCLTCASGTDALLLPLMAWDIGPGDAIFTTPFTFIATAEIIALLRATPVFVDIDPVTFNIDPVKLEKAIVDLKGGGKPTPGIPGGLRPKGIIPVDLFGLPAEYERINRIAREHGLFVLEDAAQSFGAQYRGKKAGGLAPVAATSFFPAKPLGCYGDGGAVFTDDDAINEKIKSLRVHGMGADKYENVRIGINGRMDTIQAAVLLAKLDILDREMDLRQEVAARYGTGLSGAVTTPAIPAHCRSAWAQYSVLCETRSQMLEKLKEAGIPAAIYYPKPLHLQGAFSYLQYQEGDLPVSEHAAQRIFSLPMHPYLKKEDQDQIVAVVRQNR